MDLDAAMDRIKHLDRAGWVLAGHDAPESVAAHSWGMAVRCLQHCPEDLDLATVLSMALVHDLAEAVVGDITPHDGVDKAEKHAQERAAMATIAPQWLDLWDLYEAGESAESVFVKRMDSLDMAAQAVAYERQGLLDGAPFVASAERRLKGTRWSTDS